MLVCGCKVIQMAKKQKAGKFQANEFIDDMSGGSLRILAIFIGIIVFLVGIGCTLFYWDLQGSIDAEEWEEQINFGHPNTYGDYSDGDTVIIMDTIDNAYEEGNYTIITFESNDDYQFKVKGDHEELEGEVVILTFTISSEEAELGGTPFAVEGIDEMDGSGVIDEDTITRVLYINLIFYALIVFGLFTFAFGFIKYIDGK